VTPYSGIVASDGIAGKRIQEIFDEARRIRRQQIGLCGNFLNPFLTSPVSAGIVMD
jgi:hypothetical protein